jgi:hypothetical protein
MSKRGQFDLGLSPSGSLLAGGPKPASEGDTGYEKPLSERVALASLGSMEPPTLEQLGDYNQAIEELHGDGTRSS